MVVLAALNVAAAGPLSLAWIRLLPEEPAAFGSSPSAPDDARSSFGVARHWSSLFLAALVTAAYVIRFPGFPVAILRRWLHSSFPDSDASWVAFAVYTFFVVALGLSACYASVHHARTRVPLGLAATFTLALWLLTPMLRMALLTG